MSTVDGVPSACLECRIDYHSRIAELEAIVSRQSSRIEAKELCIAELVAEIKQLRDRSQISHHQHDLDMGRPPGM